MTHIPQQAIPSNIHLGKPKAFRNSENKIPQVFGRKCLLFASATICRSCDDHRDYLCHLWKEMTGEQRGKNRNELHPTAQRLLMISPP